MSDLPQYSGERKPLSGRRPQPLADRDCALHRHFHGRARHRDSQCGAALYCRQPGSQRRRKHLGGHDLSDRQRRRPAGERLAVERDRPQALLYDLRNALFTIASLLCGLASSLNALIVFRILQGLGGGGMPTSEQAMLADTFTVRQRPQAFAIYGIAVIVAPTVGPTIGGWITDNYSWHWIFFINVPFGIVSLTTRAMAGR